MNIDPRLAVAWKMNRVYPLLLASLLIVVLCLSLLITYLLTPGMNQLERRYLDLEKRSRQTQQLKIAADTPAAIFRKGQADFDKFLALVPEKSAFTSLIKEVFDISRQSGLAITQVSYSNKQIKNQDFLEYKLNFSVTGTYAQLKKFVNLLERAERLIAIESLALSSNTDEPGKIALQLGLATYFRTEGK